MHVLNHRARFREGRGSVRSTSGAGSDGAKRSRPRPSSTRRICGWSRPASPGLGQPQPLLRRRRRGHAQDPRKSSPRRGRLKRGGDRQRIDLDQIERSPKHLTNICSPRRGDGSARGRGSGLGQLVKLRFFAGLSLAEAAEALGIPRRNSRPLVGLRLRLAVRAPRRQMKAAGARCRQYSRTPWRIPRQTGH